MKLEEIIKRPSRHWMEDGVVELAFGVQFLLFGGIVWFSSTLSPGSSFMYFFSNASSGLIIGIIFTCQWAMRRLKERVIAPRAGYVMPRQEEIKVRISPKGIQIDRTSVYYLIAAGALVLFTLGLISAIRNPEWGRWAGLGPWKRMFGPCIAILLAICLAWTARKYGMPRYYWLAAFSLALGGWLYARNDDPIISFFLLYTCLSGGFALAGAMQLRAFLKANPRIEESGE
jgi:hypothetical protein